MLLGDLPNVYVYAANNPSESIIAKRRGYGTIVSHNVPPYGRCFPALSPPHRCRACPEVLAACSIWCQLSSQCAAVSAVRQSSVCIPCMPDTASLGGARAGVDLILRSFQTHNQ